MKISLKKLDNNGFSHEFLLICFIMIFAVSGVGYMVASHAASAKNASSTADNPNSCTISVSKHTEGPKLYRIKEYRQTTSNGTMLQDHVLTMYRDDKTEAKSGYCFDRYLGWAFKVKQNGSVPLYEYFNSSAGLHYYSTQTSPPTGFTLQSTIAYVNPGPSSNSVQPVYVMQNPNTNSYFYAGNQTNINDGKAAGFQQLSSTPAFYEWNSSTAAGTSNSSTTQPNTSGSGKSTSQNPPSSQPSKPQATKPLQKASHFQGSQSNPNWSGYAALNQNFSRVYARIRVPAIQCSSNPHFSEADFWVGLTDANSNSSTLAQDGVAGACYHSKPWYYAWNESFPRPTMVFNMSVSQGDLISMEVKYINRNMYMTVSNLTTNKTQTHVQACNNNFICSRGTADWIVERPANAKNGSKSAFNEFSPVLFFDATAAKGSSNTLKPIYDYQYTRIKLQNDKKNGFLTNVGPLKSNGKAFTVSWLANN